MFYSRITLCFALRDGPLEIPEKGGGGGGEGETFSVHEFFLSPLVCGIFFPEAKDLHEIFPPHISCFVTNLRFT